MSGRVQGVFYRQTLLRRARELSLCGWVANLRDGRVEAVVEGSEDAVESLVAWARIGPPAARVTDVQLEREPYSGCERPFAIR